MRCWYHMVAACLCLRLAGWLNANVDVFRKVVDDSPDSPHLIEQCIIIIERCSDIVYSVIIKAIKGATDDTDRAHEIETIPAIIPDAISGIV